MQADLVPDNGSPQDEHDAAPEHELSQKHFYSVEYPGYVQETSVARAVQNLGGQSAVDTAFSRGSSSKSDNHLLELRLRPDDSFSHPIPGDIVSTNNLLLKVTKKKRKVAREDGSIGEYTAEVAGIIPKTVRFRSMADYQYRPDLNDPLSKLKGALETFDVESILNYKMPEEREDYRIPKPPRQDSMDVDVNPQIEEAPSTSAQPSEPPEMQSNLRLFPPTIFSRQSIPQIYNYKANPASIVTTVVNNDTGEEKKRLVNRMRWKGYGPTTIMYADTEVPTSPPANAEAIRQEAPQSTLIKLQKLFQERPVWTRVAIMSQFSSSEAQQVFNSIVLLSLVSYIFSDGPWRDTLVAFGYDPRLHREARKYQRMYFRNLNHSIERVSVIARRQDRNTENAQTRAANYWNLENDAERRMSHTFNGKTLTKDTASFQLCDITDPLLKGMIDDTEVVRESCHEKDGWYTASALERIKNVLRHKFFALLEGYVATDDECLAICNDKEQHKAIPTTKTLRTSITKHNRAKGAQRPEQLAAVRLRATLQRKERQNKEPPA